MLFPDELFNFPQQGAKVPDGGCSTCPPFNATPDVDLNFKYNHILSMAIFPLSEVMAMMATKFEPCTWVPPINKYNTFMHTIYPSQGLFFHSEDDEKRT